MPRGRNAAKETLGSVYVCARKCLCLIGKDDPENSQKVLCFYCMLDVDKTNKACAREVMCACAITQ